MSKLLASSEDSIGPGAVGTPLRLIAGSRVGFAGMRSLVQACPFSG